MAIGGPYRAILARPGALSFSASGLLSRLPLSMAGIAIILMVEATYGSYALAGRISALFVITQALCGPQIARFIDRHGQAKVMRPLLAFSSVWMVGLVVAGTSQAHPAWLYVCAALGGATIGSMGTLVRSRWTTLLDSPHDINTAFSLESALDEVIFIVGPILATFLATKLFPSAGLVVPIMALLVGGYWFLSLRDTEPTPNPSVEGEKTPTVLRFGGMIQIIGVFVMLGGIFGATDVSTIAFAKAHGREDLAGVLLAVFALGSLISGLGYGARHWIMPIWKRFTIAMVTLGFGASLFIFPTTLWTLAMVMFVAGFALAPTLITGNGLVQAIVPPRQLTEGLTYVGTSLGVGVSFGASIAGARIDAAGPRAGYLIVVCAAVLGAIFVLSSIRTLRRNSSPVVEEA